MDRPPHIHVTGASGAGVSTLGRALAARLGCGFLDTDDFFWAATDPPNQTPRAVADRLRLLDAAFAALPAGWVLAGSLAGWGDPLIARFDAAIYVAAPTALRLERLRAREHERFGAAALAPGGAMHANHAAFIAWAAQYDDGGMTMRSRARHDAWLAALPCPVLRADGTLAPETLAEAVLRDLQAARARPR